MPHLLAQVIMPYDSGLPEDVAVNTFHFTGVDSVADMATAIFGRLVAFWSDSHAPLTNPITDYMSKVINVTGARIKMYDMGDAEPRVPVFNESMGLTDNPTGTGLPEEVALCLSYSAALESGTNPARRRGRIYLGPWATSAITATTVTGNYSRPLGDLIAGIAQGAQELAAANTLGAQWVVWSRVDQEANEIVQGYVDNAWDTQRRRGARSSGRTPFTVEI